MNPYQAFPHLIAPSSADQRKPPTGAGGGLWSSVLIFRLLSAAETLTRVLWPAGRTR